MNDQPRGLLLLGTSHVGKSTSAVRIGEALAWPVTSTDKLGRHPGRPWMDVSDAVIEYYLRLSDDTIHWFLLVHHQNMRFIVGETIKAARRTGRGFVLEGAALRPEYLADWETEGLAAVCLWAEGAVVRERIKAAAEYSRRSDETQQAIEKFAERSVRENAAIAEAAERLGIRVVDVTDLTNADRLVEELTRDL